MPTPKKGTLPFPERNSVYTKTITELTAELNVPRWVIRKAVENKQLSSIKRGTISYLCPEEVERFLNKKALRLKEFESDNKDQLLGQVIGTLSDYPEWSMLSDNDFNRLYEEIKRIINNFFSDLSESLEKENNPQRVIAEKRKRRVPK